MTSKPRRPNPELRELLIHAAREILAEGDETLDLRRVARRAEKSHTAPYIAFGSTEAGGGLEALRIAVAASGFDDLAAELKAALESAPRDAVALSRVGQAYFRFAQGNVGLFRTMFGPEVARGIQRHMEDAAHQEVQGLIQSRRLALRPIQAAIEEGQKRGADVEVSPARAALAAWAMFHGAATLLIDGQFALEDLDLSSANALVLSFLPQPVEGLLEAADSLSRAREEKGEATSSEVPQVGPTLMASRSLPRGSSLPTTPALRRLRRNAQAVASAQILWVDDRPEWSRHEEQTLTRLGASVIRARSTEEAIGLIGTVSPDVVVSDIARPESARAGLDSLPEIRQAYPGAPVIFYVGRVDPDRAAPAGSFGITNRPDELVHLILDVLERQRS
jgi:CheY-like chemotaxis protein